MIYVADVKSGEKDLMKYQIYAFFAGLDKAFDRLYGDIFCMKPLPSLNECSNIIRREADCQTTMLGAKGINY